MWRWLVSVIRRLVVIGREKNLQRRDDSNKSRLNNSPIQTDAQKHAEALKHKSKTQKFLQLFSQKEQKSVVPSALQCVWGGSCISRHPITSVRASLFTRDHSNSLTVFVQSPCPAPVWLNASSVSGYLGFPPGRGRRGECDFSLRVVGVNRVKHRRSIVRGLVLSSR